MLKRGIDDWLASLVRHNPLTGWEELNLGGLIWSPKDDVEGDPWISETKYKLSC